MKLFFGFNKSYVLADIVLIKINNAYFWAIRGGGILPIDTFIRWNSIIRPITYSRGVPVISFFDKDLSDASSDKLYAQENIDSHLE